MKIIKYFVFIFFACLVITACSPSARKEQKNGKPGILAATPPMGWNSWDSYGIDVTERQVKANADYMAENLSEFGWEYVVVDLGWYINADLSILTFQQEQPAQNVDLNGRLLPDERKFPSSIGGKGFKPLADYVHSKGLKFGIHIMRGIPWQAVENKVLIKGTDVHAGIVADKNDTCVWYDGMYGVDMSRPGAQEYYNSLLELYADWGVDFIKADDMSRPYHKEEITALHKAILHCGRPIVLSLSPGAAPLDEAEHLQKNANLWRVSNDFWDDWKFLKQAFDYARLWQPYVQPGAWPDSDMLPLGKLRKTGSDSYVAGHLNTTPDKITDEYSRFSQTEQITLMSLWAVIKSPLMFGGNLPENDEFTLKLLTNEDVLYINQHSVGNKELRFDENSSIWTAKDPNSDAAYLALFNTGEEPKVISVATKEFTGDEELEFYELWKGTSINAREINIEIPPHGSKLYRVK